AADVDDELRRTIDADRAELGIDPALEAIARIAHEAEAAHLALDHRRIPERALEQYGGRVVRDAGVLAAHDAREAERLLFVRHEQQVRLQLQRVAVEQRQRLALAREAH